MDPQADGAEDRAAAAGDGLTIDQLAAAAGLPSRTVRHYQSEGALQPPRRQGRIAIYDTAHLDRLRLIARLQDRGLSLRAIRDALRQVEKGTLSLEAWLGLGEQFRAPWSSEAPLVRSEEDLRLDLGDPPPGVLAALVDAGLVQRTAEAPGAPFLVPSPGLLAAVVALWQAGVSIETGAAAVERVRKQLRRTAHDLVDFLLERTGKGFARGGSAEDYAEVLTALRAHGADAVRLVFAQEMERALRSAFERGRPRLTKADRDAAVAPATAP